MVIWRQIRDNDSAWQMETWLWEAVNSAYQLKVNSQIPQQENKCGVWIYPMGNLK